MDPIITRNLVRYLAGKGLIDRKGIVDGGLALAMGRSRNRFVTLRQRSGPAYFIKQAMESEPGTRETVAREAEIYRGAHADDRLASMRPFLPAFRLFDAEQGILVTDLITDAESVAAYHSRLRACPVDLSARLGAALGACHQIRFVEGARQAPLFPQQPPWILKLHRESDVSGVRRSPAASALVDRLLAAPGAGDWLGALCDGWRRDTLIHTDMRWENCLLAPRDADRADQHLFVIDWELADIGDAAWDVGSMFQAYLAFWVWSLPKGAEPDPHADQGAVPLTELRPAIGAFWRAYATASEGHRAIDQAFLSRCIGMMAARLMVTAFERSAWSATLAQDALQLLQLAFDILARPEPARDLLGLEAAQAAAPARAA